MKIYTLLTLTAAIAIGSSCTSFAKPANTLSPEEKSNGWELLFDGKTLDGWRGYNGVNIDGAWVVEKGTLHLANPPQESPHANIITVGVYDDFDLRFDWKVEKGTNSGVMFNVGEGPKEPYLTGPEYQVLDNLGFRSGKGLPVGPDEYSASHYAIEPAVKEVTKPVGQWNKGRIVLKGNNVQYWLNGVKTAEYVLHSAKWKKQIAESKFSKWKDFCTLDKGHIALQDHGHRVWFRNIKIKKF